MLIVGISHKTAPIQFREKLAFSPEQLKRVFVEAKNTAGISELAILSTCNRTEIYSAEDDVERMKNWCFKFFRSQINSEDLEKFLYVKSDQAVVEHLFKVTAGLDSMVLGENEILKQVKDAYHLAHENGVTGKILNVLFQRALYTGKFVRTHTGLGHGGLSVGSVAVSLAEKIFGSLHESSVLIFGAGKMAEVSARYLLGRSVKELWVANRTFENAKELADKFNGRAFTLEEGLNLLVRADVVITSMASPTLILTDALIRRAMKERQNRSLFLIDIAVPRNIDSDTHQLDNVYLYNIDDLQALVGENLKGRQGEIDKAQQVVQQKAAEFADWLNSLKMGHEKSLKHNCDFLRETKAG